MPTTLCTIGFTKSSAAHFFGRLQQAGIKRLIDVRLNNTSTLAGFTKRDDLAYFLSLHGIEYLHEPLLAPELEMLKAIQSDDPCWRLGDERSSAPSKTTIRPGFSVRPHPAPLRQADDDGGDLDDLPF